MIGTTQISPANRAAYDTAKFIRHVEADTARLPAAIQRAMVAGALDRLHPGDGAGFRYRYAGSALEWTGGYVQRLKAANLHRAYDESALKAAAEGYAMQCSVMPTLAQREAYARTVGVEPPDGRTMTPKGRAARLITATWWRGQLRRAWRTTAEDCQRELGEVRRGRQPCVSDEGVRVIERQARDMAAWAKSRELVCIETGEVLPMEQVIKSSVALPANRRAEMMTRVRGCGELAIEAGWKGQMVTLTCPSAYHARLAKSGDENPRFEGFTVREGQQYLCATWNRIRAKLDRLSIRFFGIRTTEPHHDGTPHWHMVVWMPPQHIGTFQDIVRGYMLAEYGDEPGAAERRCNFREADPAKGGEMGLVAYAAKYVAKNIDGHGSIGGDVDDEAGDVEAGTGPTVSDAAVRKIAWNRIHRIRQFMFFGTMPVGVWRELRRMTDAHPASCIEGPRAAADGSDWALVVKAQGGIEVAARRVSCTGSTYARKLKRPMVRVYRLAKRQWLNKCGPRVAWTKREARDDEMPRCWIERAEPMARDAQGRDVIASNIYSEPAAVRARAVVGFGLMGRYASATTRQHRWRVEHAPRRPDEAAIHVPGIRTHGCIGGDGRIHEHHRGAGSRSDASRHGAAGEVGSGAGSRGGVRLGSDSSPRSGVRSDLGPVAITVRGAGAPHLGDPASWTAQESSQAGPAWMN